ncbi:MAG: stage II sporulation protein M [Clostridia bacterium]|nr:stage II sporulation protein M [Clostridia bacterium]
MIGKIRELLIRHVRNNMRTYFSLLLAFVIGVSSGAFTVNGLSTVQRDELSQYFQGFLQLFDNQKVESSELLKIAVMENAKIIAVLWILGVTIIGVPFIYILVGIRGFITGFSSGFIIEAIGTKGLIFTVFTLLPKELIIIPCIIALGVNGINFSLNIVKNRSIKHISKENLKSNFLAYCFVTVFYACFIFGGILYEAYISPVIIRMIAPMITG